jgi:TolB protein
MKSHVRPVLLYSLPLVVAIAAVFVPWFSWQRRDRRAEASQVYESTTLFAVMPSPNYESHGTSDPLLTVNAFDDDFASRVGLFGWLVVLAVFATTALRARTVDSEGARCVIQLVLFASVTIVLCSCAYLVLSGVQPTDLGQDEDEWKLVTLNWVGPALLMVSSSMAALVWTNTHARMLRRLLLIELGLAVILWFSPTMARVGLTLWSGIFPPQTRGGLALQNPERELAFVSDRNGNREIYLISADGTGLINLSRNRANDFNPSWAPDGEHIAFVSDRSGNLDVFAMRADGSDQTRLTQDPADDFAPAWSPDGQWIAFTSRRGGQAQLYIMPADGSLQDRVTETEYGAFYPVWQPDSAGGEKRLTFEQCVHAGASRLTSYHEVSFSDTYLPRYPVPHSQFDDLSAIGCADQLCPSLAARDGKLVFTSDRTYNFEVYQENPLTNLTQHPADDVCPNLSSDAGLLAFASQRDGNWEIYITEVGSSVVTRLTYSLAADTAPVWRP